MHPFYLRILAFVFFVVSLASGIKLSQEGFQDIQHFKQLERLIPSSLLGLLEGENQVKGIVYPTSSSPLLLSPKSQTPSVYYRYMVEQEERDSDGDTHWVTVQDDSKSIDFLVSDADHEATVLAGDWTNEIKWLMPKRYSRTQGDFRYSEWRIEPDDSVLIFAWADLIEKDNVPPVVRLRFDKSGQYLPIISRKSAGEIRGDLGNTAIVEIWAGVSLVAISLMCLVYALQIHRILVYLSLLTLMTTSVLSSYGIASLSADVRGGAAYVAAQYEKSEKVLKKLFPKEQFNREHWQVSYSNSNLGLKPNSSSPPLPSWKQQRLTDIRVNLGALQAVYAMQISRFPENFYAWLFSLKPEQPYISLTEFELGLIQQEITRFEKTKVGGLAYLWVILGFIGFCIFTYYGFRYAKVKRMIENIPTSASVGLSYGVAEIKGKVRFLNDEQLFGPVTHKPCVWYRYLIEEHRGSGKNARWVTISDDKKFQQFFCEDREGSIPIDPEGAEVITHHKKVEKKGDMRYSEWLLKPSDKLYALGMAKVDPLKSDQLILGKPESDIGNSNLFILTNYSEKELMISKATSAIFALAMAFSGMFCSAVFYFGMSGQFAATDYLLSGLLAPIFLIFFMLVLHYNDIVFLKTRAQRNWANIQVSLKKRADLLPRLQDVLARYQHYEKNLLERITQQRQQLSQSINTTEMAAEFIREEYQMVGNLKLAIEAYPDLKANEHFLTLMKTITDLENEILLMRTGFNDAVNEYNTRIESFPDILLAKMFKFERMTLLER